MITVQVYQLPEEPPPPDEPPPPEKPPPDELPLPELHDPPEPDETVKPPIEVRPLVARSFPAFWYQAVFFKISFETGKMIR